MPGRLKSGGSRWGGACLAAGWGVLLVHCGARSTLPLEGASLPPGSGGGTTTQPDGGVTPPKLCLLEVAGPPAEIMAFGDSHVTAPSMVVVYPGDGQTGARASVALQGFVSGGTSPAHPDIRLQLLRFGLPWPAGVTVEEPPHSFAEEALGWGELAHSPGGTARLAMAWYSGSDVDGYTAFRKLDLANWVASPPVEVAPNGRAALALAPGSGVGPGGVGYEGYGYAIAWRELLDAEEDNTITAFAVLDLQGNVVFGPLWQGVVAPYPGYSPTIVWSSSAYLVATALPDCDPDDECPPTLTVERFRPASSEGESGELELTWSRSAGMVPHRPAIASYGERTWVTWMESEPDSPGERTLLLQELDPMGEAVGDVQPLGLVMQPASRPTLQASDLGLTIVYAVAGYGGEPDEPGASRISVRQLDHDGAAMGVPLLIESTLFEDYGPPQAVALDHPHGLLLTWAGRSAASGYEVAYLGFLECT